MSLLDPHEAPTQAPHVRTGRFELIEHVSVGLLLLWWIGPMTARSGGRGPGATLVGLVLACLALLATRAWRHVARRVLGLAIAVPLGATVMCLAAPSGWYGADDLGSYALAAVAVPTIAAYGRSRGRRTALLLALSAAGAAQFLEGFNAWWAGGENPSRAMVGTFYSWNPFAAFLLPGALIGIAVAVKGPGRTALAGLVVAPLCAAGIVHSSSRATLALLLLGMAASLLLLGERSGRRPAAGRWAAAVALCAVVSFGIAGPPFFAHRGSVTGAAEAKAASGQDVGTNSAYRLQFWKRAIASFEHHPVVGTGSHELVSASSRWVPAGYAGSNQAHNGYLQPLSDGGLVLGLPVLAAALAVLVLLLRLLLAARRQAEDRWVRIAVTLALGAVLAHSAVDLDWTFPSSLLLVGMLIGLAIALGPGAPRRSAAPLVVPLLLLAAVSAVAVARWDGTVQDISGQSGTVAQQAHALHATGDGWMRDSRWAQQVLRLGTGSSGPVVDTGLARGDLRWAVDRTAHEASVDGPTQVLRARALLVLGEPERAGNLVLDLLGPLDAAHAQAASDAAAWVLASTGKPERARALVLRYLLNADLDTAPGLHLLTFLQIPLQSDARRADVENRCAYALVPPDQRLPNTPDPGAPLAGTPCEAVLRGANS
ncbi:MAG: O-antigen polymerase [Frankiales bacterium]|nr:O-antigen polymerase [Frankiales bacterium]